MRIDELPRYEQLGSDGLMPLIDRFTNFGWLVWETNRGLMIRGKVLDAVEQIENPPPKDYWKSLTTWFRSKPWSIPVLLLLIVLPLVVKWIEMIQKVLRWVGVLD